LLAKVKLYFFPLSARAQNISLIY